MKTALTATALTATLAAGMALAEPQPYEIDPAHSELLAHWQHADFSTTRAIVFDISGDMTFDEENPANSSVSIRIPTTAIVVTPEFEEHLLQSGDFFQNAQDSMITFDSTSIEVTGENTADITGDLTLNGVTNEVVLESTFIGQGESPTGDQVAAFGATTTLDRTNFNLGAFTPVIPAEVHVEISLEASPASE